MTIASFPAICVLSAQLSEAALMNTGQAAVDIGKSTYVISLAQPGNVAEEILAKIDSRGFGSLDMVRSF
jgi:hypothetical protein